ncbi:MAG TPA: nucleotidyltransferase domain-containing protein, partial [Ferruginibacter sp.]|nr:nucleotidyltransferase domain-containing protein [Ferruginibacter sp.]
VYGDDVKALDALKGVGESIARKIIEYLHTGRIRTYEQLKRKIPQDLLELMQAEGIGPATIRQLHDELHISTRQELAAALAAGKLETIRGFGKKRIALLYELLKPGITKKRFPLAEASRIARAVLREINKIPHVQKASIAGSIRRKKETIGDIDIIVLAAKKNHRAIIRHFISLPGIAHVIAAGATKASVQLQRGIQADIRVVEKTQYGSALFYFTGSREHNIRLRTIARKHGWRMNEYGVFDTRTGKRLAGDTEESIYQLFGLSYIPPEQRTGGNELVKAGIN